jgi:hypothetical protein
MYQYIFPILFIIILLLFYIVLRAIQYNTIQSVIIAILLDAFLFVVLVSYYFLTVFILLYILD